MNISGLLVGAIIFLLFGLFHILVVKAEYYCSKRVWPLFLIAGVLCLLASAAVKDSALSCLLAVLGFTWLWSIRELFEQEERVQKGWFPRNPNRQDRKEQKASAGPIHR